MLGARYKSGGFTIVELLIVIVVIGILAALVLNSFSKAQEQARATAIADGLSKTEKAFKLFIIEESRSAWWIDNELTGSGNPTLASIINNTNLRKYLPAAPAVQGMSPSSNYWFYDNDGDNQSAACSSAITTGVNIYIANFTDYPDLALEVDKRIDDGNVACGKLRYSGSSLKYSISDTQEVQ